MSAAALDWRAGRAAANGIEIAYEEAGPAHADAVLLVMGLSWQLIHWPESYCRALVDRGLRVIRFDNRDAGLSSTIDGRIRMPLLAALLRNRLRLPIAADYTLHDLAADTLGLLDALGIARAHLVGVSMGGMIAQIVAATAPARVASLTSIMSTTNHPWLPGPSAAVRRHLLSRPENPTRDTLVARDTAFMALIGSPRYPTPEPQRRALAEHAYDRSFRPGGIRRQTHAIVATGSFEPLLGAVRAPTQIIHGDADPLVRLAGGRRSARCIRGAKLQVIEGMGHDLPAALIEPIAALTLSNLQRA